MMRRLTLVCALLLIGGCASPPPAVPTLMVLPSATMSTLAARLPTATTTAVPTAAPTQPPALTPTDVDLRATHAAAYPHLAGVDGVVALDLVSRYEGLILLEVRVREGDNRQAVADALLLAAQQLDPALREFGVILSDSTSATDYVWRAGRNAWIVTPLTQFPLSTATALAAARTYACNGVDDLNCDDFSTATDAQAHLNLCGNEDRLDGDSDGRACEFDT